jgi:hypothetical protein
MLLWLKICDFYSPHEIRKVIGFDFFDSNFVEKLEDKDKNAMGSVFQRCNATFNDISLESIQTKIINAGFSKNKFELVKGDLSQTSKDFIANRPGFRISLLYLDVDLEEPTYNALVNMWDRVVPGGIVVFDEYGYHAWSESNAVDRFIREKNLKLIKLHVPSPTAYIIKD